jgi:hypothetical protein
MQRRHERGTIEAGGATKLEKILKFPKIKKMELAADQR